jgi:hypothetical protein
MTAGLDDGNVSDSGLGGGANSVPDWRVGKPEQWLVSARVGLVVRGVECGAWV